MLTGQNDFMHFPSFLFQVSPSASLIYHSTSFEMQKTHLDAYVLWFLAVLNFFYSDK